MLGDMGVMTTAPLALGAGVCGVPAGPPGCFVLVIKGAGFRCGKFWRGTPADRGLACRKSFTVNVSIFVSRQNFLLKSSKSVNYIQFTNKVTYRRIMRGKDV